MSCRNINIAGENFARIRERDGDERKRGGGPCCLVCHKPSLREFLDWEAYSRILAVLLGRLISGYLMQVQQGFLPSPPCSQKRLSRTSKHCCTNKTGE